LPFFRSHFSSKTVVSIENAGKKNHYSGYVHPEFKTQFQICTSGIQNPILDNDVLNAFLYCGHKRPRASTANVNCLRMFISGVFNNDFWTLASIRLKSGFWISISVTTSAQTKYEKQA